MIASKKIDYHSDLLPEKFYHVYNHAVGDENLFRNSRNFRYFLGRYSYYLTPVVDTYAYCLLPNHFHLLVRIKSAKDILEFHQSRSTNIEDKEVEVNSSRIVIQQFKNLFNAYAKALNKTLGRKGALFVDRVKRKKIENQRYFIDVVKYIHHNPVHHKLVESIEDWSWSSYHAFVSSSETKLMREQVLKSFGSLDAFIELHKIYKGWLVPEFEFQS